MDTRLIFRDPLVDVERRGTPPSSAATPVGGEPFGAWQVGAGAEKSPAGV